MESTQPFQTFNLPFTPFPSILTPQEQLTTLPIITNPPFLVPLTTKDYIQIFRWIVYIIVGIYVLKNCLCKRKRVLTDEQRVRYKFKLVNAEVMRHYDQEDKRNMEVLLRNTIKNINVSEASKTKREIGKSRKESRIRFRQQIEEVKMFDRNNPICEEIKESSMCQTLLE